MKARAKLWLFGLALGLMFSGRSAFAQTFVSLTFDDGLLSATTAQNVLDAHNMKGTFYIISGLMGSDPNYYLDLAHVKAIATDGHEIAGHTVTHPDLTTLTAAEQEHEICDGRAQLIADGFTPQVFAYPYGNASAVTTGIVKACGYANGRGAWCNFPQYSTPNDQQQGTCAETIPPGSIGVLEGDSVDDNGEGIDWTETEEAVSSSTTLGDLETYVTNAENPALADEGLPVTNPDWVILQFHFICGDTDPTCGNGGGVAEQYGITISTFTAFLDWLKTQPVTVEPLGQVMGVFPYTGPAIPAITSLTPSTMTVTGSSQTLTVAGVNFVSGSSVTWNGSAIATTFVSSTSLTAVVPATDLLSVQITTISVTNPGPVVAPGTLLTLINPVPVLTTLSSTFTVVGSTGITLIATGSNFVSTSTVRWNGSALATTFVSSTSLSAVVPAIDLSTVKIDSVTIFNPAPGGGISSTQTFTVVYPLPILNTLSSTFTVVGSSTFTLTLTGSNFVSSSTVRWNGSTISTTTFVSSTTLRTQIPASALTSVGIDSVTVVNPLPGGGVSSTQTFIVGNPGPVLTTLSSTYTIVGSTGIALTATGSNFIPTSIVQWNGLARSTTFINSTTLTAQIPAGDLATVGVDTVNVFTPGLGGGTSGNQTFTVVNPVPVTTVLSSTSAIVGSPGFTLNVTGSNFVASSIVQWNGLARATTFVNSTTLAALILTGDLASTSLVSVTVFSPAPGGGTSNSQTFTVGNPGPGLLALSPNSAIVGSATSTMTVTGLNFVNGSSIVQWNGSARTTTFVNSNTLTALILNSDLASVGIATVTVDTTGLGGGISNVLPFTVGFPVPLLTAIDHPFVTAGGPPFTLTATGNFAVGSVLEWNGSPLTTISATNTTLSATVPSSDFIVPGNASITVYTPPPGGGTSHAFQVTISSAIGGTSSVGIVSPRVHPNPWRSDKGYPVQMTFDQLPLSSTVKIFTTSAHWVKSLDASSGSATWDLTNDSGNNVASGFYIYLITYPGGSVHGTLAVIR